MRGLERNMLVGLAQGAARRVGPSVNKEDAQTHLSRISPFWSKKTLLYETLEDAKWLKTQHFNLFNMC